MNNRAEFEWNPLKHTSKQFSGWQGMITLSEWGVGTEVRHKDKHIKHIADGVTMSPSAFLTTV